MKRFLTWRRMGQIVLTGTVAVVAGTAFTHWFNKNSASAGICSAPARASARDEAAVSLPPPTDGKGYTHAELQRIVPDLMADFEKLKEQVRIMADGLPDFQALASKVPAELERLARQLSDRSRQQFRALVQWRMQNFTVLERAFGGPEIAERLLAALDAADGSKADA